MIPASCPRSKPAGRWPALIVAVGAVELTENRRQVVVGARRPRRASPRARQGGARHLRARRAGPRRAERGRGAGALVESLGRVVLSRATTR